MADRARIPLPLLAPIVRAMMGALFRSLGGITTLGAERFPRTGPVLICPNHRSDCDPFAVFVTCPRRDIYFVAKDDFFHWPPAAKLLRACGAIPIKRDSADRAAIREASAVLESGGVLILFPEGRLSETGELGRIQPGAALIAMRTGAPIVPVGLARTNRMLPYGHIIPQPSRLPVRVVYGEPIEPSAIGSLTGRKAIDEMTSRLEAAIRRLTGEDGG
jgi:1-acyl-sn-glycerol-3-phosphate acyltransferase